MQIGLRNQVGSPVRNSATCSPWTQPVLLPPRSRRKPDKGGQGRSNNQSFLVLCLPFKSGCTPLKVIVTGLRSAR